LVSADFAVSDPRISFAALDGEVRNRHKRYSNKAGGTQEDMTASDMAQLDWGGTAYDYEVPYGFTPARTAGYWGMIAEIDGTDGSTTRADFVVEVQPTNKAPAIGAAAPTARTAPWLRNRHLCSPRPMTPTPRSTN
jgi:hypothetical protein